MRVRLASFAIFCVVSFGLTSSAFADELFTFTVTIPQCVGTKCGMSTSQPIPGSGTLVGHADATISGAYDVTSGSFNFAGYTASINPAGTVGDNILYTTSPFALDTLGLEFLFNNGSLSLYSDASQTGPVDYRETTKGSVPKLSGPIQFSYTDAGPAPSATPEPSSFVLLGTSFLGMAGISRRRFRKT